MGSSWGGVTNSAPSTFSEVPTIQRKGTSITRLPARSALKITTRPRAGLRKPPRRKPIVCQAGARGAGRACTPSGIGHPPPLQPELHHGDQQDGCKQGPAHGRRIADTPVAEGVLHNLEA